MTTCKQMLPAIGAAVTIRFESLTIQCTVEDVKNSYGKPRLLISPVAGNGSQWVELGRVVITSNDMCGELIRA